MVQREKSPGTNEETWRPVVVSLDVVNMTRKPGSILDFNGQLYHI